MNLEKRGEKRQWDRKPKCMAFVFTTHDLKNDRVWIIVRVGGMSDVHRRKKKKKAIFRIRSFICQLAEKKKNWICRFSRACDWKRTFSIFQRCYWHTHTVPSSRSCRLHSRAQIFFRFISIIRVVFNIKITRDMFFKKTINFRVFSLNKYKKRGKRRRKKETTSSE